MTNQITNTSTSKKTIPTILFAETTIYKYSKASKNKDYSSNITVIYKSNGGNGIGEMPLYQIYYNSGNKCWGLWKCPYTKNKWENVKWYPTLEIALQKAKMIYNQTFQNDLEGGMEYRIKTSTYLTYYKKMDKSKHPKIQEINEETFFTL